MCPTESTARGPSRYLVVTNNRLCPPRYEHCEWVDGDFEDVLRRARDLVHRGHALLSYPLGASVRMHFSPVVSVLMTKARGETDAASLQIMEESMALFRNIRGERGSDTRNREAYEMIDMERLAAAVRESDGTMSSR